MSGRAPCTTRSELAITQCTSRTTRATGLSRNRSAVRLRRLSDLQPRLLPFFFQAEDGIRDRDVTGVQTCALPICNNSQAAYWPTAAQGRSRSAAREWFASSWQVQRAGVDHLTGPAGSLEPQVVAENLDEIGRASCRERVAARVGGVSAILKLCAHE